MDRYLSLPNFDASRRGSNSLAHDHYYFSSASAPCHRREAMNISSQLSPLHPISTAHKVFSFHLLYTPSKVLQQFAIHRKINDDTQTAISKIAAALRSLGFNRRRRTTPQNAVQLMMHNASTDAVPQPVPIPMQISLLMPAVPVNGIVANAPSQRVANPTPTVVPATTNPPPPARPE